jgi:signal transduction histidine kinase
VRIEGELPSDIVVHGHGLRLQQALVNVLTNACQASSAEGRVRLEAARVGDRAVLQVTDWGQGMSAEVLERAFDAFFSTRELCEGLGLGLHLVQQIIEREHGGVVRLESVVGTGTTVTMELPL